MSQVGNHSFEFPASQGVQGGTVTLFLTIPEDRWLVSSLQIITAIHWHALSEKLIQIEYENF